MSSSTSSSDEEDIFMYYWYKRMQTKKKRKYWNHPYIEKNINCRTFVAVRELQETVDKKTVNNLDVLNEYLYNIHTAVSSIIYY